MKISKNEKKDNQFLVVLSDDLSKLENLKHLACLEALYFGVQKSEHSHISFSVVYQVYFQIPKSLTWMIEVVGLKPYTKRTFIA